MSVAKLAPVVFAAANAGHPEMIAAVQNGAHALAEYTRAVARRLEYEAPEVRLLGGLFEHHPEYADYFADYAGDLLPGVNVEVCVKSGALGAAWLASRVIAQARSGFAAPYCEKAGDMAELSGASTEQRNPRSAKMDEMGTGELVDLFICEEDEVARALAGARTELIAAVEMVSAALAAGGRLFYTGAGTSGRLGVLDASEIPPTFGAPPELVQGIIAGGVSALHSAAEGVEDEPEAGELAVVGRGVRAGDVVCGIAASGRTPFVLGTLRKGREVGAKTILLTCNPARKRAETWDVEIDLAAGAELVTGSTRLKAGTATKVVLNMISTCAMVRLGKVKGNLMIDMQATNGKLRDRAVRLVMELKGCGYEEARGLLEEKGWSVRGIVDG
jgi:N-acetylmuramic acid 6-phosphate etherase